MATFDGTLGPDSITASTPTDDSINVINGLAGNDTIVGGTKRDLIDGGDDDDNISSGLSTDNNYAAKEFHDTVYGGAGNDIIYLEGGGFAYGGSGNDRISGGINAYAGVYEGDDGDDSIYGSVADETISGGAGNDYLYCGSGNDIVDGGTGNDTLRADGLYGNSVVSGGAGDDLISYGASYFDVNIKGIDTLTGGSGRDVFSFATLFADTPGATQGYAIVTDFNASEDFILLNSLSSSYLIGSSPIAGVAGQALYLDTPGTEPDRLMAVFQGVSDLALNSSSFLFKPNLPVVTIAGTSNGSEAGTPGTFTLTRTGDLANALTVSVTTDLPSLFPTTDVATSGVDYQPIPNDVTFAAGSAAAVVNVTIINDLIVEPRERITMLVKSDPSRYTLNTNVNDSASVFIESNLPTVLPTVSIQPAFYPAEENSGLTEVTFTRTGDLTDALTVYLEAPTGTAINTVDYLVKTYAPNSDDYPRSVTFAAGTSITRLVVDAIDDSVEEGTETINFAIAPNPALYNLGTNTSVTMNLIDNDGTTIGTSGDDDIFGTDGTDTIFGYDGNDSIAAKGGDDLLFGGNGYDQIFGWGGNDTLFGDAGNDFLIADDGDDFVYGGLGDDEMYGSAGIDNLEGNEGNDTIVGGDGDDGLAGQEGNDFLVGGNDNDRLYGWTGSDTLYGGTGRDTMYGDDGDDLIYGGFGNDSISAGQGIDSDDLLIGGNGNDQLYGMVGNDTLIGDDGNDRLSGGFGNDQLTGGGGSDSFIFGDDPLAGAKFSSLGKDTITDFQSGTDKIVLQQSTFSVINPTRKRSYLGIVANDSLAANSDSIIVYSKASGSLFYNANRDDAGFGAGGAFAQLSGNPSIVATDFVLG